MIISLKTWSHDCFQYESSRTLSCNLLIFFFTHDVNAAMVYFCGLYKHHKGHPLCTKDKKRNLHKYFCGLYKHHKGHPLCTKDKKRNLHKYFCWEARQNDKWQIKKKDNKIRVHFFLSTCRVCVSLFIYKYI
jgi:hypothetical protein